MKTIIAIVTMAIFPLISFSQNKAIDDLFNKYAGRDGFTTVDINGGLLKLASFFEKDSDSKDLMKTINHIRILAMEKGADSKVNFYKEVIDGITVKDYEELMTVKDKDQDVRILVKQADGRINELLMIVGGSDNALISITGKIDPRDLSQVKHMVKGQYN